MPNLKDHAQKQAEGLPQRLDDIQDTPVTVSDVTWHRGNFGEYAIMRIITPEGETFDVMTSAMLVLDALKHAEEEEAFPCDATFTRKGRTWIIA